jgi:monofunctional biosynthetic peptidoglycan transglycosylase
MAEAKRRNGRRVALGTAALAGVWLFGVWPPPLWWRDHWPRETAMMRAATPERSDAAGAAVVHAAPLAGLASLLPRMVVIGEDSRFRTHHGIDPTEIADAIGADRHRGVWATLLVAWRERDRLRGASTITQQLAKNLYLSSSRNPLRKLKEAVTALRLEVALSKDRILELYLGVAEWGPGVWGAEAASRAYFGVPPAQLTDVEAAELAATLPHPRSSNPIFRPERMLARRNLILARYRGAEVAIPGEEDADSLPLGELPEPAPPSVPESRDVRLPVAAESSAVRLSPGDAALPPRTARGGRDSLP